MPTLSTVHHIYSLIKDQNFESKTVLELGYLKNAEVIDLKQYCVNKGANFYRTNLVFGEGVDFNWDLHKPLSDDAPHSNYDYVICSSVMEHVAKPWIAAKHIEDIISDNGKLVWTTPWVWRMHGYPSDYWRFTPEGVKQLFSKINWEWTGIEILFHGSTSRNRSFLVEWNENMKDPAFALREDTLKALGKMDCFTIYDSKESIPNVYVSMSEKDNIDVRKKIKTKNLNETIYQGLVIGSELLVLQPMSSFIMIGKKKDSC